MFNFERGGSGRLLGRAFWRSLVVLGAGLEWGCFCECLVLVSSFWNQLASELGRSGLQS